MPRRLRLPPRLVLVEEDAQGVEDVERGLPEAPQGAEDVERGLPEPPEVALVALRQLEHRSLPVAARVGAVAVAVDRAASGSVRIRIRAT